MEKSLPAIPAKRYFTIGEVSELCGVKPYVLRYWEQEFSQLKPIKRRGNRRYYQHHEVLLIRRIGELLYEQGFTISGARNRLGEEGVDDTPALPVALEDAPMMFGEVGMDRHPTYDYRVATQEPVLETQAWSMDQIRGELLLIRALLD
jgi:DNA-binding transcriptional MerR regulator